MLLQTGTQLIAQDLGSLTYQVTQEIDFNNYLHTPPNTPAILQSHRYHHVMPSSSGAGLVAAAVSSLLIVSVFYLPKANIYSLKSPP